MLSSYRRPQFVTGHTLRARLSMITACFILPVCASAAPIDLSLHLNTAGSHTGGSINTTQPATAEVVGGTVYAEPGDTLSVELHADAAEPTRYNAIQLYIQYDPDHVVLLGAEPAEGWTSEFPYEPYASYVVEAVNAMPCNRIDPDPTDDFGACFESPPVEPPINERIDDGAALWIGHTDWQEPAETPSVPVRFIFEVVTDGVSCIRISEPWRPFPGGNKHGAGPPTYEHAVSEVWSQVLYAIGPNLAGTLTDVCVGME